MINLLNYANIPSILQQQVGGLDPWVITGQAKEIIKSALEKLNADAFSVKEGIAIHRSAVVEQHVVLKAPVIISENCFVGAHAYLRGGVFLDRQVSVGPGCEVKSSLILAGSALAHFNFVGDSLIGSDVNMEAGAIICNHYNERQDKAISVLIDGQIIKTGATKFGALVGNHSRIGANAVLSPGSILPAHAVVKRLELVQQIADL